MKYLFALCMGALGGLTGCATAKVAHNMKFIAFTDKRPAGEAKSLGTIEGRDCLWYVFGHALGMQPTIATAFANTANQTDESLPLQQTQKAGTQGRISFIRNVTVDPSGFNAYVVGRSCINVKGLGFQ